MNKELNTRAFENVKDQIGYCGIWCGSCIVGNGLLRELTKKYEFLINGYGVDSWGAKDFDGKEFNWTGRKCCRATMLCPRLDKRSRFYLDRDQE